MGTFYVVIPPLFNAIALSEQNPYAGPSPAARKVLIVCPVSLIMVCTNFVLPEVCALTLRQNWKAEFQKWLGKDRVGVIACNSEKVNIDQFFYK